MSVDKQDNDDKLPTNDDSVTLKPSEVEPSIDDSVTLKPSEVSVTEEDISIERQKLPSINKILITDDGKEHSNEVLNYAAAVSKYSGAELVILRILENISLLEDVSVEGTGEDKTGKGMKREVKGEIIDEMEKKIRRCKEAGCENKISYKFRVGNPVDEIVKEVKEGNHDLIVLKSSHTDSRMRSLFSDSLKIISNITIPVLMVQ